MNRRPHKLVALMLLALSVPAFAQEVIAVPETPPLAPPKALPDEPGIGADSTIYPGDQWMIVRLYIDKNGRPDKCRTVDTNITSKDKRFWICQTMMHQWHTAPIIENGVAVKGTVVRRFVIRAD